MKTNTLLMFAKTIANMPKRPPGKECIDIRVCVDAETNRAIIKYQSARMAKEGLLYPKSEAASDLFMKLVKWAENETK